MGSYWTLDGMLDSKKKNKKHEGKEKDKKKDKKKKKKDKKGKSFDRPVDKKETPDVFLPYSEFLRSADKGLFVVKTMVDNEKLETYIIKSDEFTFPRVALSRSSDSYKDWLSKKIASMDTDANVNKVLYASAVKRIDIPKGLLNKIIKNSGDEE